MGLAASGPTASMSLQEPLRFRPILIEKVWGGDRLAPFVEGDLPEDAHIGEIWSLVAGKVCTLSASSHFVSSLHWHQWWRFEKTWGFRAKTPIPGSDQGALPPGPPQLFRLRRYGRLWDGRSV